MCSIIYHCTSELLKGKVSYTPKALDLDKAQICVMQIRFRRHIIYYIVHPMQFLIYNNTGTPRVEVHSQGHTATESQGRIRTKISDFLFNAFYSHIHTLIHRFPHSFNNGVTQVNLCQKTLGINHAKEGKSKHPLTDHLPITVPKESTYYGFLFNLHSYFEKYYHSIFTSENIYIG